MVSLRKRKRIISYAASLANGKIAESEEVAFVKLLKNVDAISVREEKLAEQVTTIDRKRSVNGCRSDIIT